MLRYPDGWRRSSEDLAVADLGLDDPIVLTPGRAGGAMIMAGLSPATGATLLPGGVARRLSQTPVPARVKLGRLRAYHYADLRVDGLTRTMTVFAVPTSDGALTMACLTPPRDAATARAVCERVAQSLRLKSARALALGPSRSYQQHLNELVKALDGSRIARRAELASARSSAEQVRIAEQLATAFARARAIGARAAPLAARGGRRPAHPRGDRRRRVRLPAARAGRQHRQRHALRRRAERRAPRRAPAAGRAQRAHGARLRDDAARRPQGS